MPEDVLAGCLAWEGVVYALDGGKIAPVPFADEGAPPSLVLADFGRQLRYSVMEGPEVEIWDQLFDVNARAGFLLLQAAIADMRRRGAAGAIVNILSMNA